MNNLKGCLVYGVLLFLLSVSFDCQAQAWQWAIGCGSEINDDYGTIASDNAGNTYLTGKYSGIGVFGNDTLIPTWLGGTNLPVMFCKIDPSGNFKWVKSITGPQSSVASTRVATNKNINYIYFYGGYTGQVNIGGNNFNSGRSQIFLSKYLLHLVLFSEDNGMMDCNDEYG